jgi:hypothetical protein
VTSFQTQRPGGRRPGHDVSTSLRHATLRSHSTRRRLQRQASIHSRTARPTATCSHPPRPRPASGPVLRAAAANGTTRGSSLLARSTRAIGRRACGSLCPLFPSPAHLPSPWACARARIAGGGVRRRAGRRPAMGTVSLPLFLNPARGGAEQHAHEMTLGLVRLDALSRKRGTRTPN